MPHSRVSQTKNIFTTATNIQLMQYKPNFLALQTNFKPLKFNHIVDAHQQLNNICSISMT